MTRPESPPSPDFRLLFEATPSPYLVLTPQLPIAAVNDAYLTVTGRTRDDLLGRHLFDAFPDNPDDPEADGTRNLGLSLQAVLRDGRPHVMAIQRYDIPVVGAPDGRFEERYWSPVNTPVFGTDGAIVHIIHRVEDVTALVRQRQAQEAAASTLARQEIEIEATHQRLRDSQEQARALAAAAAERRRLDAVLGAVPVSVFVVDAEGLLLLMNEESRTMWGRSSDQVGRPLLGQAWQGRWADGRVHDGQPVAMEDWPLARALGGERVQGEIVEVDTFEVPPRRRVALISAAPVHDEEGRIAGAVVASMDITDRVRAEQALREADRRKDEFLAMLAHELRNPLAPIRSAADLLALRGLDADRLQQTSDVILRQVRHMTGMIDDLLDVSRVTRGLVHLDLVRLDARDVLAEAAEQARPLVDARRQALHLRVPDRPCLVMADRKRLVQVVANLLGNAAKYTPDGGRIEASVEVDEGRVLLAIHDDGIGMAPDLLAHAFDLFAQGERSSDRGQGGLGIGLALVRRLVELHGGAVSARSDGPGCGSCLTVDLPVATVDWTDAERAPVDSPASAEETPLRVLVVDDNPDAADMLGLLLETMGHQVAVEHDSTVALARALREGPEACLLDIGLPGMDGYELAGRLRQSPATARALLVAVTGYGHEQDRLRALAAGFDHHLVKPVDAAVVEGLLARAAHARA